MVMEIYQNYLGQQLCKTVKNSHFLPKTHRSAFTKKCKNFAGPLSQKNAENPQVCGHGKMQKTRTYAVM